MNEEQLCTNVRETMLKIVRYKNVSQDFCLLLMWCLDQTQIYTHYTFIYTPISTIGRPLFSYSLGCWGH